MAYVGWVISSALLDARAQAERMGRLAALPLRAASGAGSGEARWLGRLEGPDGRKTPRGVPAAAYVATYSASWTVTVQVEKTDDAGSPYWDEEKDYKSEELFREEKVDDLTLAGPGGRLRVELGPDRIEGAPASAGPERRALFWRALPDGSYSGDLPPSLAHLKGSRPDVTYTYRELVIPPGSEAVVAGRREGDAIRQGRHFGYVALRAYEKEQLEEVLGGEGSAFFTLALGAMPVFALGLVARRFRR